MDMQIKSNAIEIYFFITFAVASKRGRWYNISASGAAQAENREAG